MWQTVRHLGHNRVCPAACGILAVIKNLGDVIVWVEHWQ